MDHISAHDLERYHLGMITDETELAPMEEHLLVCPACLAVAAESEEYVDQIRAAILSENLDLSAWWHRANPSGR